MNGTPPVGQRTIAPLFTWRSAISDSDLPPTVRHVLLALSLYMNERGGSAYPGSARLAHDTGLHQTTVKRALALAVDLDWIRVLRKGGSPTGGQRLATEYVAHVPVDNDREHTTTGSTEYADRGSSMRGPVAEGDPITPGITPENSRVGSLKADPSCVQCWGEGHYLTGAGFDRPCPCCDPRPLVATA